jgi:hypothetical protein
MGAYTFIDTGKGKTAKEAFLAARDSAAWEHGHGGYTGTIAEKHDFTMIPFTPTATDPAEQIREASNFAHKLIDDEDPRINDKWGPAGCIALPNFTFLFFGLASS